MPLTDLEIRRAKPAEKTYTKADGNGLSLHIEPNGSKGWRFRYRFEGENELSGHSFGNLFITALAQVYDGDIEEALEAASKLLRVRGRVIPSSTEFIKLRAEMTDGTIVEGESNIPHSGKRIRHILSLIHI